MSVVENVGRSIIVRTATNDGRYEMPSRHTITGRMHELDEKERTAKATPAVALTGDNWTSLGSHNYLGVTVHYIDEKLALHSHSRETLC